MLNPRHTKVILLAEDDTDDRELFCEALSDDEKNSPTIQYAENGRDALAKLEHSTQLPDIIFLDINMPVMNGWQCLKAIREDDRYKNIPVVVYSSSSHQREKDIAVEMGATCFFTKPDNFKEFKEKLELIVERQGKF